MIATCFIVDFLCLPVNDKLIVKLYNLTVHLYKTEAENYDLTVRLLKYDTVV